MEYQVLFHNFMRSIQAALPKNKKPASYLAEALHLSKEAVYRRLRMEVPFSFAEIAAVAKHLGFSVDHVIHTDLRMERPLQITDVDYGRPGEADFQLFERYVNLLKLADKTKKSEITYCCNALPMSLYTPYESITRFFTFKWEYLNLLSGSRLIRFSDVKIPEKMAAMHRRIIQSIRKFDSISYILDHAVISNIVQDVVYFEAMHLMTKEQVGELKDELLGLINEMERFAGQGSCGCGNKARFFVSNMNFQTGYIYAEADDRKLAMFPSFVLNHIFTFDKKVCEKTRSWICSLKRTSTLISESGEQQRIVFFNKQREILNTL